jgi:hypothetical protein
VLELALKTAKVLLPNDATTDNNITMLLKAMSNHLLSKRFTLPEKKHNKKGCTSWTKNSAVIAIKGVVTHLDHSDQALRVQLIHLLGACPSTWMQHFTENVGKTTATMQRIMLKQLALN